MYTEVVDVCRQMVTAEQTFYRESWERVAKVGVFMVLMGALLFVLRGREEYDWQS